VREREEAGETGKTGGGLHSRERDEVKAGEHDSDRSVEGDAGQWGQAACGVKPNPNPTRPPN